MSRQRLGTWVAKCTPGEILEVLEGALGGEKMQDFQQTVPGTSAALLAAILMTLTVGDTQPTRSIQYAVLTFFFVWAGAMALALTAASAGKAWGRVLMAIGVNFLSLAAWAIQEGRGQRLVVTTGYSDASTVGLSLGAIFVLIGLLIERRS
jgi:hypothetical protein